MLQTKDFRKISTFWKLTLRALFSAEGHTVYHPHIVLVTWHRTWTQVKSSEIQPPLPLLRSQMLWKQRRIFGESCRNCCD
ncbi:hypothetical protein NPIL_615571 [Nephila pilipes]|uniref:Uncharacterized protein n=1 Tax=Nephila pilipes TaxID=299642 RepID=A0A8X6N6D6_NEPPI|nr:hypothetical protein NPIL_615571 [Nephila pilipes]